MSNGSSAPLSRRTFVKAAAVAGALTAAPTALVSLLADAADANEGSLWSDPRTWGGRVPGRADVARVTKPVTLDVNAEVAGVIVEAGGTLTFRRDRSVALASLGNVIVDGVLQMAPASALVSHQLVFPAVDETRFVGGGMTVLASDVGLWVRHGGRLRLAGTPRVPWVRAAGSLAAGATTLQLRADPTGWRVGDELAITPTAAPDKANHHDLYDYATIADISGTTVTLSRPLMYAHPSVPVGRGTLVTAEVLNLTRNVRIRGSHNGRAHIWIHPTTPQVLRYATLSELGPRRPDGDATAGVLGRYGLHFHMGGTGSEGSLIEGVVARNIGNHALVTHESHGVTFRGCITHDTIDDPYWYDQAVDTRATAPPTNRLTYDGCVASRVKCDPSFRGFRLQGFALGAGVGNVARNCVAVGVQGNLDASGFGWPELSRGVWTFENSIAHNNRVNGIFTWQNSADQHVITSFIGYYNGVAGIAHGAYVNAYKYENSLLYGNRLSAVDLHSHSHESSLGQRFEGLLCDGAGLSDHVVRVLKHTLFHGLPSRFVRCTFRGYRKSAVAFIYTNTNGASTPEQVDLIDCTFAGQVLWLASQVMTGSVIRIQDPIHGALTVRAVHEAGALHTAWNARVTQSSNFSGPTVVPPLTPLMVYPAAVETTKQTFRRSAPLVCPVSAPEVSSIRFSR